MPVIHPDKERIALGIRQPWAELILRGVKTIEVRSRSTSVRGTIYVYASKKFSAHSAAESAVETHNLKLNELPLGVIVGTVDIVDSVPCRGRDARASCVPWESLKRQFGWRLENPMRFESPLTVRFLPYGVWFYPFQRKPKS